MAKSEGNAIAKKQIAQREAMWPGMSANLWNRKLHMGYATIPKTLPLILNIMDEMSKGKPLSSTYLSLWCATWDNGMVNVNKPGDLAHSAGFSGQRAVYTWAARVQLLHELHFIDAQAGKSGDISHILIWNPHYILRWHRTNKTPGLTEGSYNALLERAVELGTNDLLTDQPTWLVEGPFSPTSPAKAPLFASAPPPEAGVAAVPLAPPPPARPKKKASKA